MKTYQVTGIFMNFASGILRLTDTQAAARKHCLRPTGTTGEYEVLKPVQFKRGEVVGYSGEVPKALAQAVEEQEGATQEPKKEEAGGQDGGKKKGTTGKGKGQ